MNEELRDLPDGHGKDGDPIVWFTTNCECDGERTTSSDFGEIWWPFALNLDEATDDYNITHLPSGYKFGNPITLRKARTVIVKLRALPLDWNFTKPKGKKWEAVKVQARPLLESYNIIAKRKASASSQQEKP